MTVSLYEIKIPEIILSMEQKIGNNTNYQYTYHNINYTIYLFFT